MDHASLALTFAQGFNGVSAFAGPVSGRRATVDVVQEKERANLCQTRRRSFAGSDVTVRLTRKADQIFNPPA